MDSRQLANRMNEWIDVSQMFCKVPQSLSV